MSEPRFDWEADRDEWERFREMDRKWKATVDRELGDHRQRLEQLEAHVKLVGDAFEELGEQAERLRGRQDALRLAVEGIQDEP